jgi:hypothetical protein
VEERKGERGRERKRERWRGRERERKGEIGRTREREAEREREGGRGEGKRERGDARELPFSSRVLRQSAQDALGARNACTLVQADGLSGM